MSKSFIPILVRKFSASTRALWPHPHPIKRLSLAKVFAPEIGVRRWALGVGYSGVRKNTSCIDRQRFYWRSMAVYTQSQYATILDRKRWHTGIPGYRGPR